MRKSLFNPLFLFSLSFCQVWSEKNVWQQAKTTFCDMYNMKNKKSTADVCWNTSFCPKCKIWKNDTFRTKKVQRTSAETRLIVHDMYNTTLSEQWPKKGVTFIIFIVMCKKCILYHKTRFFPLIKSILIFLAEAHTEKTYVSNHTCFLMYVTIIAV